LEIALKFLVRLHADDEIISRQGISRKNPDIILTAILGRHHQLQPPLKNLLPLPSLNQQQLVTIRSRHSRFHFKTINIYPDPVVTGIYTAEKSQLLFKLCIFVL